MERDEELGDERSEERELDQINAVMGGVIYMMLKRVARRLDDDLGSLAQLSWPEKADLIKGLSLLLQNEDPHQKILEQHEERMKAAERLNDTALQLQQQMRALNTSKRQKSEHDDKKEGPK